MRPPHETGSLRSRPWWRGDAVEPTGDGAEELVPAASSVEPAESTSALRRQKWTNLVSAFLEFAGSLKPAARRPANVVSASLTILSSLSLTRQAAASCGVAALAASGLVAEGAVGDLLAFLALLSLTVAVVTGFIQFHLQGRIRNPTRRLSVRRQHKEWFAVYVVVAFSIGLALQTWFKPGTGIATGDITPPVGAAWVGRIFEPWLWTGSNLGEPSQLAQNVPWAAVIAIVHLFGGDAEAAQRIWYTALYIGAALSAVSLIAALGMRPLAGLVGGAVYVLNPYVVSEVNTYPNYVIALSLLAGIPAVLIAIGRGWLSMRWGALAMVAAGAPLLGTAFSNPPLAGMILGVCLATPLLVAWIDGKGAALRTVKATSILMPLLAAASAFWLTPAIVHLSEGAAPQLATTSSWAWTEGRATLRNAFWLNTLWAWTYPEYFPYAPTYDTFPVSIAKFVLPAMAFGALALADPSGDTKQRHRRDRAIRLGLIASTAALLIIFLSTGTRAPGNVIFDRLYQLPFGWLLREPGRFLMVGGFAYAVLAAAVTETLLTDRSLLELLRFRRKYSGVLGLTFVPVALATCLLIGFPLVTGVVVPDSRPVLPSAHVKVPGYWPAMAQLTDSLPVEGAVLVMPPDDFYQMPYKWGYYGNDGFIVELFSRRVLIPNGQGYFPTSSEVTSAISLTAKSILERNWPQTEALVTALNTPLILVRHDVDSAYPGRSILSSDDLGNALAASSNFALIRKIGSLELFALTAQTRETDRDAQLTTINTDTPDLRLLSVLPPHANLVSTTPRAGVANVIQAPRLEMWNTSGGSAWWTPYSPDGWSYSLADLAANTTTRLDHAGTYAATGGVAVAYAPYARSDKVAVSIPARSVIANGDFAIGPWGPVADCNAANPTTARSSLVGEVIPATAPGGLPALRLSASGDSACESQPLSWKGGAVVINLYVRHISGVAPRLCLWEVGPSRCASLPDLPSGASWSWYRASVAPDSETLSLILYLYADGGANHRTINDYANVNVVEVPSLPNLALLGNPQSPTALASRLVVFHTTYSTAWQGSTGQHVLVNGMVNGWLVPAQATAFTLSYTPGILVRAAQWTSFVILLAVLAIAIWPWTPRIARRRFLGRRVLRSITARLSQG